MDALCVGVFRDSERVSFVAARGLALKVSHGAAQSGIAGLTLLVSAYKHSVVIGQALI